MTGAWEVAARAFELPEDGDRLWSVNGSDCFVKQAGPDFVLTVAGPGGTVRYQVPGVDWEAL